jgi:hypothetical protein
MDRRGEQRRTLLVRVQIDWTDGAETRHATAWMEDLSPGGACLRTTEPLPIGVRIRVAGYRTPFAGIVRYRLVSGADFIVGLQRWEDLPKT